MVPTFVTVWALANRIARVASGQLAATPPRSVMKSRRFMLAARLGSTLLALRWPLCVTANCGVSGQPGLQQACFTPMSSHQAFFLDHLIDLRAAPGRTEQWQRAQSLIRGSQE